MIGGDSSSKRQRASSNSSHGYSYVPQAQQHHNDCTRRCWNEVVASRGLYYCSSHRHRQLSHIMMMMSTTDQCGEKQPPTSSMTYDCNNDDDDDDDDDAESDIVSNSMDSSSSRTSLLLLLHQALMTSVQSALQSISRKTASLERELSKARTLEDTMKRANLIVSNLYRFRSSPGTVSAEVEDWENGGEIITLTLNTKEYSSAQEESDSLFALARKIKRGSKIVEELMHQSVEGEQILRRALADLESISIVFDESDDDGDASDALMNNEKLLIRIQECLELTSSTTGFKSPTTVVEQTTQPSQSRNRPQNKSNARESNRNNNPNPRVLKSPSGHQVLVGRNRRDNEAICFQLSKPTDIWLHARGCPGAHVLLCVRRGSPEVQEEDLQFAANLAAFFSNARTEAKAAISTAEPKHITKPRGAPLGAVSLRHEGKTLIGRPEDVSDELKEAREKSGAAWDELGYRALGTRVKNTKKTAVVEKARRDKSREDAMSKNKRKQRKEEKESWY